MLNIINDGGLKQGFFPGHFRWGVKIYLSDPHLFPLKGDQPKISPKLSSVLKRTENFQPLFENPDPFFKCLFPFLLIF